MKKMLVAALAVLIAASCAPVLRKDLMDKGTRAVSFRELREQPIMNKGRLFILGGLIASTKLTPEGSLIEAVYIPVDSLGYLENADSTEGRFYALMPKERGFLDPMVFKKKREITVAGVFSETRTGKMNEVEVAYPLFIVEDIYLWREYETRDMYDYHYYYPYTYSPYMYPYYYPNYYPYRYYPYWWSDPSWRFDSNPPPFWRP
jgi:outer membrane lipoprotein